MSSSGGRICSWEDEGEGWAASREESAFGSNTAWPPAEGFGEVQVVTGRTMRLFLLLLKINLKNNRDLMTKGSIVFLKSGLVGAQLTSAI